MRIIRISERIKFNREKLGLNRSDFFYRDESGKNVIDKSVMCKLEHGDRKLSKDKAEIIAKIMNDEIDRQGNKQEYITVQYLTESEEDVTEKVINDFIAEIKVFKESKKTESNILEIENISEEIDIFVREYDIKPENKIELLHVVAQTFYRKCLWRKSLFYIQRCKDIAIEAGLFEKVIEFINSQVLGSIRVGDWESIIKAVNYAIEIYEKHKIEDYKLIHKMRYNKALALFQLSKFEKSMEEAEYLKHNLLIEDKRNFLVNNLISQIYFEQGNLEKTEEILLHLQETISVNDDIDLMSMLNINLVNLNSQLAYNAEECKLKNESLKKYTIKAKEYLKSLSELEFGKDPYVISVHLYEMISSAIKLNEEKIVNEMYKEAIEKSIISENKEILYKLIMKVLMYYIETNKDKNIDKLFIDLEDFKYKLSNSKLSNYYLLASQYFKNDVNKCNEYLKQSVKVIGNDNII